MNDKPVSFPVGKPASPLSMEMHTKGVRWKPG